MIRTKIPAITSAAAANHKAMAVNPHIKSGATAKAMITSKIAMMVIIYNFIGMMCSAALSISKSDGISSTSIPLSRCDNLPP